MSIRVWQAFSCNNSAAYRLIARFADAAVARRVAAELAGLLRDLETPRLSGLAALAQVYGLDWRDGGWGDAGDGPHVVADENLVLVHHDYCLGMGPGLAAYLAEQAAVKIEKETAREVHASLLFRATLGTDPRLDEEVGAILAALNPERTTDHFQGPWAGRSTRGRLGGFRDAGTIGLFFPIHGVDLAPLRAWLAHHAIENPIVRIEEYEDLDLFEALAGARCTSCEGALEYLDPRLHDIESPQLVCKPCGGLYELSAFVTP